jgi:tetratricopeptide (TPR) repeat protein
LEINSDKFGSRHPLVAGNLNGLGMVLKETGKDYDEAMEQHRRALQIFEESFGHEHDKVALTLNYLAEVMRKQGKNDYDESESLYERALRINKKCFGGDHPEIAENINGKIISDTSNCQSDTAPRSRTSFPRAAELRQGRTSFQG